MLPGLLVSHSAYAGRQARRLTDPVIQRSIVMPRLSGCPPSPAVEAFSSLSRDRFRSL